MIADLSAAQVENLKKENHISADLDFKIWIEDTNGLPRHIHEEFAKTGFVAHVLKYADRYEVRYCRNGYNIRATHSDLPKAIEIFLDEARRTEERRETK